MKKKALILILLLIPLFLISQTPDKKITFGALTQFHFSCAQSDSTNNPYGFRIRRIVLKAAGNPSEKFTWKLLIGLDDLNLKILEADANFNLNEKFRIRVGQFAPPAIRSGAPVDSMFKVPTMSLIERPPITLLWAEEQDLISYRTFGIQIHGNLLKRKLYYGIMIGNPKGDDFFSASSFNTINEHEYNGMSYWGRLEYSILDNFVTGIFTGKSHTNTDSVTINRLSCGAHILYNRNNIRFMTEFVQGKTGIEGWNNHKYRGWYLEGGYRMGRMEPTMRYDFLEPRINSHNDLNIKKNHNYTLGVNFYIGEKMRIQANYIFKREIMKPGLNQLKNNLFYINLQYQW